MNAKNRAQLVALAAIWGGSFMFMRVLARVLGPKDVVKKGASYRRRGVHSWNF